MQNAWIYRSTNHFISASVLRRFATAESIHPKCLYTVLNLRKDASPAEIKTAYYGLSKVYHPDKNDGSEEAAHKFREITSAYEVLGNDETRVQYDHSMQQ